MKDKISLLVPVRVFLLVMACLTLMGCVTSGPVNPIPAGAEVESVRGFVNSVESESLLHLEVLEVVDEGGRVWRIDARGTLIPEFTPSHLNEHKVLGLEVTVSFYREGDVLVLTNITD